jgi:hypothetical protein
MHRLMKNRVIRLVLLLALSQPLPLLATNDKIPGPAMLELIQSGEYFDESSGGIHLAGDLLL